MEVWLHMHTKYVTLYVITVLTKYVTKRQHWRRPSVIVSHLSCNSALCHCLALSQFPLSMESTKEQKRLIRMNRVQGM